MWWLEWSWGRDFAAAAVRVGAGGWSEEVVWEMGAAAGGGGESGGGGGRGGDGLLRPAREGINNATGGEERVLALVLGFFLVFCRSTLLEF